MTNLPVARETELDVPGLQDRKRLGGVARAQIEPRETCQSAQLGQHGVAVFFQILTTTTLATRLPSVCAQRERIIKRLMKGAMANGFTTELWTTSRVATIILQCCKVQYHRSHVARLLHDFGFSCQKPERRALERDEARIEQWKRKDWPRKKTLRGWVRTSSSSTNPASC
ncbi:MAG: winged helix-turn-helix domain-containing protein [Steroidobacteraceae bacterium]